MNIEQATIDDAQEILAVLTDPQDWPVLASAIGRNIPD